MTRDPSTVWDESQRYGFTQRYLRERRLSREEAKMLDAHPYLCPYWTGPTNPQEAVACDRVMVALGTILAQRQFSNHYDTDAIYRAMRGIRKG